MAQEIARVEASLACNEGGPLRPEDMVNQVALIQEVMTAVMKKDEHYGVIPGCGNKPTLLQPGAEKIAMVFRMAPDYLIERENFPGGHRDYTVTCRLSSVSTGLLLGSGVGSCSTMESKYRYRNAADYEITGEEIPKDAKERKQEYRRQGFGMKQIDGVWEWVKYTSAGKVENPDIADVYNTVLKMAKKRAFIDAVKSTTAASDIFTQDIEDMATAQATYAQQEPAQEAPDVITAEQLDRVRALRSELGVDDEKYAKQLAYYGADVDTALTGTAATRLIGTYETRIAKQNPEPVEIEDDEIPF